MSGARDPEWLTAEMAQELLSYEPDTGVFTWKVTRNGFVRAGQVAGQVVRSGYRSIAINRRGVLEHRLAWLLVHGRWPVGEIDHVNRERTDNRLANLREVTRSQNMHNTARRRAPASGESGIYRTGNQWAARISFQGEEIYLGRHEDLEVILLTRALAKMRALRGVRPQAAAERVFIRDDSDQDTGEILETAA